MPTAALKVGHGTIQWWRPSSSRENIGDFLSRYLLERLFVRERVTADVHFLIGSVISAKRIEKLVQAHRQRTALRVTFWCCGCRDEAAIPRELLTHAMVLGARGPLTASVLGLDPATPLGDPAFLLPLLYQPKASARTAGKTIFVPHVYQSLIHSEEELRARSGADVVLSPLIMGTASDVELFIDQICASSFVATSSLHGAVIACAYGVPFAFFDCGYIDIPFKWRDFSASICIGTYFPRTLEDARLTYGQLIAGRIRRPPLMPMLGVAPFVPRDDVLRRADVHRW